METWLRCCINVSESWVEISGNVKAEKRIKNTFRLALERDRVKIQSAGRARHGNGNAPFLSKREKFFPPLSPTSPVLSLSAPPPAPLSLALASRPLSADRPHPLPLSHLSLLLRQARRELRDGAQKHPIHHPNTAPSITPTGYSPLPDTAQTNAHARPRTGTHARTICSLQHWRIGTEHMRPTNK